MVWGTGADLGLGMPIPSDQLVTYLPWDVIMIIASVICAIACMQLAGGMDYLVHLAEKPCARIPNTSPSPRRSSPT